MYLAHGGRFESIDFRIRNGQFGIFQLQTAAYEIGCNLVFDRAYGSPCDTLELMIARRWRDVTTSVAVDFRSTETILMPHFKVKLWPSLILNYNLVYNVAWELNSSFHLNTLKAFCGIMKIYRVRPGGELFICGIVYVRLSLFNTLQ